MSGNLAEIEPLRASYNLTNPIVHLTSELMKATKTETFPFGYLLSPEGKVLAKGLVRDNDDLEILKDSKVNEKKRWTFNRPLMRKAN